MTAYFYERDTYPPMRARLTRDSFPINLTGALSVQFVLYDLSWNIVAEGAAVVEDVAEGLVAYEWLVEDLATHGIYKGAFTIEWPEGNETVPDPGFFTIVVHPKPEEQSS